MSSRVQVSLPVDGSPRRVAIAAATIGATATTGHADHTMTISAHFNARAGAG